MDISRQNFSELATLIFDKCFREILRKDRFQNKCFGILFSLFSIKNWAARLSQRLKVMLKKCGQSKNLVFTMTKQKFLQNIYKNILNFAFFNTKGEN